MARMQRPSTRPRRFLGWDTVVGGAAIQTLQAALFFQSFGVYVVVWAEEFGWSLTAISSGYALLSLLSGILGPFHGRLLERVGVRRVVFGGLLTLAAGLFFLSSVTTLPAFYAAMFVTGLGLSTSGFLSITTAIVPWFVRRRSTALALMSVGISLGGLFVPWVAGVVVGLGWRPTLQIAAVVFLAAAIPLTVLMRRPPEAYGQRPDGLRPDGLRPDGRPTAFEPPLEPALIALNTPGEARPPAPPLAAPPVAGPPVAGPPLAAPPVAGPQVDHDLRQAMRTGSFWLLGVGHGTALLVIAAMSVHLVAHLADGVGLSLQGAAGIVALVTVMSAVGQLIGGPLGDRFDKRRISAVAMLAHGVALLALAWGPGTLAAIGFAVVHGLAWGIRGPLMTSLRADYFGTRHFGSIMGASLTLTMVGQLAGPVLAGTMTDAWGDYRIAFSVMAVLAAASSLAFLGARPPGPPAAARTRRDAARSSHT